MQKIWKMMRSFRKTRQINRTSSKIICAFEENKNKLFHFACSTTERSSVSQLLWIRHNSAFGVCNCVTSSIASKLTQPVLSTLTGGPAKKGFVTLSPRVGLMLCSTVKSHSFSFALCLHPLHWVHMQRGSVLQMHADKLGHESEKIGFVQRAHTHTRSRLHPV